MSTLVTISICDATVTGDSFETLLQSLLARTPWH